MSVLSSGMLVFGYVLSFLAGAVVCLVGAGAWRRFGAAEPESAAEQARRTPEVDRLRGVSQSLPGIEFQYRVDPDGTGTTTACRRPGAGRARSRWSCRSTGPTGSGCGSC
ncbi:hypothetical protein GGP50_000631 [Salinibacter ruber]|nr:hypothetical protein [Salinibacter ruber]